MTSFFIPHLRTRVLMIYLNQTIVRIIGTLIINNSLVLGDESKMNKVYAVKGLDTGLYLSEVAGCIFARRQYENYVYEKKAANQVMQDAKSDKQANRFGFKYSNLVIEPVELYTVPIVKHSIDKSWSKKIRHGLPFEQAVNGCALEQVRLFGSFIKPNKEISKHSFHFNMIRG